MSNPWAYPYAQKLLSGQLIRRYQRFFADVNVDFQREPLTVHCPNTGAMRGLLSEGAPVLISRSNNPNRRLSHTLEAIQEGGVWIGVNTQLPNRLVLEGLRAGAFTEIAQSTSIRQEVPYDHNSRVDFVLEYPDQNPLYIEVKNVHDHRGSLALFPDSPTERGRKHLEALTRLVSAGGRACVLYVVQRPDVDAFTPNESIDPLYAEASLKARQAGVLSFAYAFELTPSEVTLKKSLPVLYTAPDECALEQTHLSLRKDTQ